MRGPAHSLCSAFSPGPILGSALCSGHSPLPHGPLLGLLSDNEARCLEPGRSLPPDLELRDAHTPNGSTLALTLGPWLAEPLPYPAAWLPSFPIRQRSQYLLRKHPEARTTKTNQHRSCWHRLPLKGESPVSTQLTWGCECRLNEEVTSCLWCALVCGWRRGLSRS